MQPPGALIYYWWKKQYPVGMKIFKEPNCNHCLIGTDWLRIDYLNTLYFIFIIEIQPTEYIPTTTTAVSAIFHSDMYQGAVSLCTSEAS